MSAPVISFDDVYKVFISEDGGELSGNVALSAASFNIQHGEFVSLVGPSGCGKSTALNLIAGLLTPTEGTTSHDGRTIDDLNVGVGYVTQGDTLLPWRTLLDNVAYGLELAGVGKSERRERAHSFIRRVGLQGFERHYPHQLSGGMRKRAALVRTLVSDPDLILMDEPFGALDAQSRLVLQHDLLKLWRGSGKTIVFVTHDLVEGIALSDRVMVFGRSPGRVKSIHPVDLPRPRDVFHIHEAPGFDALYERIWGDVREELSLGEWEETADE